MIFTLSTCGQLASANAFVSLSPSHGISSYVPASSDLHAVLYYCCLLASICKVIKVLRSYSLILPSEETEY